MEPPSIESFFLHSKHLVFDHFSIQTIIFPFFVKLIFLLIYTSFLFIFVVLHESERNENETIQTNEKLKYIYFEQTNERLFTAVGPSNIMQTASSYFFLFM